MIQSNMQLYILPKLSPSSFAVATIAKVAWIVGITLVSSLGNFGSNQEIQPA